MAIDITTIEIDAQSALNIIQTFLPILENYVPAVGSNAADIQLAIAAAAALIPLLEKIPSGTISAADQAALAAKITALQSTAFQGPEWQPGA